MPLVIALIFIIGLLAIGGEQNENDKRLSEYQSKANSKTNAILENDLFCKHYYEDGLDINESYDKSVKDIVEAGFVPCISKVVYEQLSKSSLYYEDNKDALVFNRNDKSLKPDFVIIDCSKNYDSDLVRFISENLIRGGITVDRKIMYGKKIGTTVKVADPKEVYRDFPKKTSDGYGASKVMKRSNNIAFAKKVGDICTIPMQGTYKVANVIFRYDNVYYELESIKDGSKTLISNKRSDVSWL